jgi:hypothetical protein
VLQFTVFSAQTCAWLLLLLFMVRYIFEPGVHQLILYDFMNKPIISFVLKKKRSNVYLTLISKIELKKLRKGLNLFHHQTCLRMFSYLWQIHFEHNKKRKEKKSIRCVLIILIFFREVIRCIHEIRVRHYFLYRESQYNLKFMIF